MPNVIGIGATCAICGGHCGTGEQLITGWGDGTQTVHLRCNLKRLGIDQSVFGASILPTAGPDDMHSAAVAMGRKGGSSRSAAKIAAVRENGKKGGRPKKAKEDRS